MIYLLLFFEFAKISLVCVGGGYASMPLIQNGQLFAAAANVIVSVAAGLLACAAGLKLGGI